MGTNDGRAMPATSAGAGRQTVADITTTTEEEGERMSNTLHRAVADASCIIVQQEDQIQRALQVLQKAQRYAPENAGEMEACSQGGWIPIDDVVKAIRILQEGQP